MKYNFSAIFLFIIICLFFELVSKLILNPHGIIFKHLFSSIPTTSLVESRVQQAQLNPSFINPIKLTRMNYLLCRIQVLSSIRANAPEGRLINGTSTPPNRILVQGNGKQGITTYVNTYFISWQRQDQVLRSWILSSMTEGILGTMTFCTSSFEVWMVLERTFSS